MTSEKLAHSEKNSARKIFEKSAAGKDQEKIYSRIFLGKSAGLFPLYRNQLIDLQCNLIDWFLYDWNKSAPLQKSCSSVDVLGEISNNS